MEKGLAVTNVPIDANMIKIPIESMANLQVDQAVKEKLAEYESVRLRKTKFPGYV
jgi:hypothetical protein